MTQAIYTPLSYQTTIENDFLKNKERSMSACFRDLRKRAMFDPIGDVVLITEIVRIAKRYQEVTGDKINRLLKQSQELQDTEQSEVNKLRTFLKNL